MAGRPQHRVRRLQHGVVAVTLDAGLVEDLGVDAALELRREDRVARAADVGDGADARRRGAVIAVTVVARRRREIVAFGEGRVVHAFLVVRQLAGRQRRAVGEPVLGHVPRIRVAGPAGRGDVGGKDRRLRVADQPNPVRAVAAGAGGDVVVARGELFAVHARRVLGRLIDALFRREAAHQAGVAVAARARRNLRLSPRRASESLRRAVRACLVAGRRVAAVTVGAGQAALAVDVRGREQRRGSRQPGLGERRMTGEAGVGRRRGLRDRARRREQRDRGDQREAASGDLGHDSFYLA